MGGRAEICLEGEKLKLFYVKMAKMLINVGGN